MRQQLAQETVEIMRPFDVVPAVFQQRLQELLGRLLAEEADLIMKRVRAAGEHFGGAQVLFGLVDPLPNHSFHRALCRGG
jgi:hypothetical protein